MYCFFQLCIALSESEKRVKKISITDRALRITYGGEIIETFEKHSSPLSTLLTLSICTAVKLHLFTTFSLANIFLGNDLHTRKNNKCANISWQPILKRYTIRLQKDSKTFFFSRLSPQIETRYQSIACSPSKC